ncbi:MAG: glutaredoxin family protein [Gammaproteobacteria bacterium]
MKPTLIVYLRHDCHLCEAFMAELQTLQSRWEFDVTTRDIDADPVLRERYDTLVPVLTVDGREVCHYFLDPERLAPYFERA